MDVQVTGEAFSPRKIHPALQNIKFLSLFSIFVGHFCPPGFGSRFRIRIHWPDWIRIRNTVQKTKKSFVSLLLVRVFIILLYVVARILASRTCDNILQCTKFSDTQRHGVNWCISSLDSHLYSTYITGVRQPFIHIPVSQVYEYTGRC